jgi:hypothetical protein
LIETIVFDALIGNSDRHQENWAIINVHTLLSGGIKQIEKEVESGEINATFGWLNKFIKALYTVKGKIRPEFQAVRLLLPKQTRFAPIYDSGCSFGRELSDERIFQMLKNEQQMQKYIAKGLSEIHWENNKISHFELVTKLLQKDGLKQYVIMALKRVIEQFDEKVVKNIILNIDKEITDLGNLNFLPNERKEVVLKLLTLRLIKLREIYSLYK